MPSPGKPGADTRVLEVPRAGQARDEITAEATVTAVRDDKPITVLATTITNQGGVVVLDDTAVGWRDPAVRSAVESAEV